MDTEKIKMSKKSIFLPLIRKMLPNNIAAAITNVQPMTSNTGSVFTLNSYTLNTEDYSDIILYNELDGFCLADNIAVLGNFRIRPKDHEKGKKALFICSLMESEDIVYLKILKNILFYGLNEDSTIQRGAELNPHEARQIQSILKNNLGIDFDYELIETQTGKYSFYTKDRDSIFLLKLKGYINEPPK